MVGFIICVFGCGGFRFWYTLFAGLWLVVFVVNRISRLIVFSVGWIHRITPGVYCKYTHTHTCVYPSDSCFGKPLFSWPLFAMPMLDGISMGMAQTRGCSHLVVLTYTMTLMYNLAGTFRGPQRVTLHIPHSRRAYVGHFDHCPRLVTRAQFGISLTISDNIQESMLFDIFPWKYNEI